MILEVKRFYMPGVVVTSACPKCGEVLRTDLGDAYLSYPDTDEDSKVFFDHNCPDGEYVEWQATVRVVVSLRPVTGCVVERSTP